MTAAATVYREFNFLTARNLKKCELVHSALELGCLLKGEIFHMVNIHVPAGVGAPPLDTTSGNYSAQLIVCD